MKLGLQLGYWGAQPPEGVGELVAAAEDAGFDALFTAEAWGSDAFTPLAWWGRETSRMRLGTSIVQMSGRTPTSIAMHALTLDHLSGGRVVLGSGDELADTLRRLCSPVPELQSQLHRVSFAGVGACPNLRTCSTFGP